jgi:flavin reductase (DIM6/NTAB) family NADH-FMN oxidoreductase RutF
MTHGIYVLTTRHKGTINAMIASWVAQASYTPQLIMKAIHPNHYCHELIQRSGSFALHVIEHTQGEMIDRMMGSDPSMKFDGIDWHPGRSGSPILDECLAWFDCTVKEKHQPGNHTVFFGLVVDTGSHLSGRPMITSDCKGTYIGKS